MATDLQPRKTSRAATSLQRKFADMCARIRRVDLVAHFLILTLILLSYAFLVGTFDWFAGNSTATSVRATRWIGFGVFAVAFLIAFVQTVRCLCRNVSPYYVAHQLEQTLPDSKNSLINWLDLHEEDIPSAFQKNLSGRAEEQMAEADADQTVRTRKNWVLLGALGVPALGLLVLLIFGPSALAKSLLRGFVPFYTPPALARTQITLVQPESGDAEVGAPQAIAFVAKIEGRVPTGNRPDAPTLHFRYQKDEDYRTRPLQTEGGGEWTATLQSAEIRTGFTYKITAGDAETPEHQVRVRGPAHVRQFEIAYEFRPYRKLRNRTDRYPNREIATPSVGGPHGSEVEMIVHASRPVKKASVEFSFGNGKRELPGRMIDPQTFAYKWMLERPGQFRVLFTTPDGEDNTDRDWHPIQVTRDEAPTVVLKKPGRDVSLAENGTLVLEGHARSDVGVKNLTLQMRVLNDANKPVFPPKPYRPERSLQFDDGSFQNEVAYVEVVGMDEFKRDGVPHRLAAGTVIEYWLEAADCTDTPDPNGRIGKSTVYKITLTAPMDAKQAAAQRQDAKNKQQQHAKQQDSDHAKKNHENRNDTGGKPDPQQDLQKAEKQKKDTEKRLGQADKDKNDNEQRGGVKSGDEQNADKKDGPQPGGDGGPREKNQPPMTGDETGASKEQGGGSGGTSKDSGTKKPEQKDNTSQGDRKDGPKETSSPAKDDGGANSKPEPSGGVKDGGDMGMNTPMPAPPKMTDPNGPMPTAKGDKKGDDRADGPPQGDVKGVEQNGPDVPHKGAQGAASPPEVPSKGGGMMNDAGSAKDNSDQANAGKARSDEPKTGKQEVPWPDIADAVEKLNNQDGSGDPGAKMLKDIANNSSDSRKRDLAKEILEKNGRDPKTGEKKKGPNPFGSGGGPKTGDIPHDVKLAVANREFAAKIGQMQLDDWKKRVTPDLLKRAGLSDADWQRYVKTMQAHDALVRQLNAQQIRDAQKKILVGKGGTTPNPGARIVEGAGSGADTLDGGRVQPPPELIPAHQRFSKRPNP